MAKVTIAEIAEAAGVSSATVSMVLSNKGKISENVITKVKTVANNLGYTKIHKKTAETYVTDSKTIGMLIDIDPDWDFAWRFIRPVLSNIEAVLKENNYIFLLIPIHLDLQSEEIVERVISSKVCAVLSMHYGNRNLFQELESKGVPVVVINNSNLQNIFHTVCVDDIRGCYDGTRYLIKNGHRSIGYVEYERPDMQTLVNDRFMGYKNALESEGIEFESDLRITTQMNNMQDLYESLDELFREHEEITALICHDDYLADNVIAVLTKLDKRVPEDISIIAPGDVINYNEPHVPQITTMRINKELMGRTAGEVVINRLKSKHEGIQVLKVNQVLIDRGSVRNLGS